MFALGIQFDITVPENVDIDSYEIVRVPRTDSDKTRICSGVISKFYEATGGSSGSGIYYPVDNLNDITTYYSDGSMGVADNSQVEFSRRDLIGFYSPEVTYDFKYPQNNGQSKLKVTGIYDSTTKYTIDSDGVPQLSFIGSANNNGGVDNTQTWFSKARSTSGVTLFDQDFHIEDIKAFQRQVPGFGGDTPFSIENLNYRNYCAYSDIQDSPTNGSNRTAYGGTTLVCKMTAGDLNLFDLNDTATYYSPNDYFWRGKLFYVDFIKFNQDQYGGIGVEALTYNNFISISNTILSTNTLPIRVFGGDIFVGHYEFMKTFWDNSNSAGDNNSFYEDVVLPIESTIQFDLNIGKTLKRGSEFDHDGDGDAENYRSQEEGMFIYNSVFSSEFMSRSYFTKPFDFKEQNTFDVRSYLSDPKIIGESIDSWSKFRVNNFLDGEANLGPINRIHSYLNEVFFLQDKGVGYITINPRAITNTTDGQPTELGSAEGLIKYNYLSKDSGSIHQRGSLVIPNGLVYYDGIKQSLGILKGTSSEDLSVVKGMDSHFKSLSGLVNKTREEGGDNPLENAGVHLGKNLANEEVYITSLSGEEKKNIVYNYRWDIFTAFYSFTPNSYIHSQKFIMSSNSDNDLGNEIYIHNKGLNGILYGNTFNSEIESIITESPGNTKVVKYIQYDCINKDVAGNYLPNEGLDTIRLKNDYQDTGVVSLTNRQRNRFNVWKIKRVPRNSLSLNKISRVRSDWFTINLGLNNTNNREFNLERIITVYRTQ
jgi:hypothetical protein